MCVCVCVCVYKQDLALNMQQGSIYHKTQLTLSYRLLYGVLVPVRIPFMGQIELSDHLLSARQWSEKQGSIPGRVIPKTQKMVLDASLLNTQHYKVRFEGKVEQSREMSRALPYTLV